MRYTEFNAEQQQATLRSRIAAWEADHFGHEINKAAFASLPPGEERDRGIKDSNDAQAVLESSITVARAKLDELKAAQTHTSPGA